MINEYGAVGVMRNGRGNRSFHENLLQCHFVNNKFHMI
jgi:hypothetical protein